MWCLHYCDFCANRNALDQANFDQMCSVKGTFTAKRFRTAKKHQQLMNVKVVVDENNTTLRLSGVLAT